jgi:hypothetical protein
MGMLSDTGYDLVPSAGGPEMMGDEGPEEGMADEEMAMDDEDRLIQAVILHTLETVRGADRRGLLDDLTLEELKVTVLSDLGII